MNKNGIKGILDNKEKEVLLRNLIVDFDEQVNSHAKIKYKDIFEYVKEQAIYQKIDFYPSYTWWKTKGKHLVDEYNLVKKNTLTISETEKIDVFDIDDVLGKYAGDKVSLKKYLGPYKILVERLCGKINELQSYSKDLKEQNVLQKKELITLDEKITNQQRLIDSLFYEVLGSKENLVDVLSLGELESPTINAALTASFSSPKEFIDEFNQRIFKSEEQTEIKSKNNVIKLHSRDKGIFEDDYDY